MRSIAAVLFFVFLNVAPALAQQDAGFLGVSLAQSDDGVRIDSVTPGGPAEASGLLPGDVIQSVNGIPVAARQEVVAKISGNAPGETVTIKIQRPSSGISMLSVKLGERPTNFGLSSPQAASLEDAIASYENTLEILTREISPERWAKIQHNLAAAYSERVGGARAENIETAIRYYEAALEVYTREVFPEDWAMTQNNLATAYTKRIAGSRAENLETAIRHYEAALEIYTRDALPQDWAMTQYNLAITYRGRIEGASAENLEAVIGHYEAALEVYTHTVFPDLWAGTRNNLGNAYSDRIAGSRANNLEMAIRHYEAALEVYTRKASIDDWAMTQNNLAAAYIERIEGARAENLEIAIRHSEAALEIYTREAFPEDWAMTQNNLANAYSERIVGSHAGNLEAAIRHSEAALEIYTREAFPEDWAGTRNNLATFFFERIAGARAENLEIAIRHSEAALEIFTRDAFPEDWAMTQTNLAIAYRERIAGSRAENLEAAIRHSEAAQKVRTREAFPEQWALTQNNLAAVYSERIAGARIENLEMAIEHYEAALEVFTREAFPEDWAMTRNNLAIATSNRIAGTRAENLEAAIRNYEAALEVFTREAFPEQWATTQHNLASAYSDRIVGSRTENLETAIRHYEAALEVFTREAFPEDWAMTRNNLASTYTDRIAGSWAENLEAAIRHSEAALEIYTREAFPEQWAGTQNNLGNAYNDRITDARTKNLKAAIMYYEAAMEVYTREAFPKQWAETQNNLALAYSAQIRGSQAENLETAIGHYEAALEILTREAFPREHARTSRLFGDALVTAERLNEADTAYRSAMATVLDLAGEGLNPDETFSVMQDSGALFTNAALLSIQLGDTDEALRRITNGRARLLTLSLNLEAQRFDSPEDAAAFGTDRDRLANLRAILAQSPAETSDDRALRVSFSQDITATRGRLRALMERAEPIALRPAAAPAGGALVYMLYGSQGGAFVILRDGSPEPLIVAVQGLTAETINLLWSGDEETDGWADGLTAFSQGDQNAWLAAVDRVGSALWPVVGAPLAEALQSAGLVENAPVALAAHGPLATMPIWLAAEPHRSDTFLFDRYRFTVTMGALQSDTRSGGEASPSVRGLAGLWLKGDDRLRFLDLERRFITLTSGDVSPVAVETDASATEALRTLGGHRVWHFSTHGTFNWGEPRRSGVVLGYDLSEGDEKTSRLLTVDDLLTNRVTPPELAVFSACEVGLSSDARSASAQQLGLPMALASVGVDIVVAPIWSVYEVPTVLLMARFYERYQQGHPPQEALRDAQQWLRTASYGDLLRYIQRPEVISAMRGNAQTDLAALKELIKSYRNDVPKDHPPFNHPAYWAAFTTFSGG